MSKFVLAVDQGTTSSRAMLFNHHGDVVRMSQREHAQLFPQPGWVEHDPVEIWRNVQAVIADVLADIDSSDVAAVGITNQRETTVVWNRHTGEPVYPAIVWQDTRTQALVDQFARRRVAQRDPAGL